MRILKLLFSGIFIAAYLLAALIGTLTIVNKRALRSFLIRSTSFFSNMLLTVLGITVVTLHSPLWEKDKPYLIVSNHLSYLDILAIASVTPSVFVSSMEGRAAAFLGLLAGCGGTLFVERRNKANLKREIAEITGTLKEGLNVVIFPEGTSSNGERVLPFKRSLMETAFLSKSDVLPVCLTYSYDEEKLSGPAKDSVYWYGDMTFFPHFFNLLKKTELIVTFRIMEPLRTGEYASRSALAGAAYQSISASYDWQKPCTRRDSMSDPMDLSFQS